MLVTHKTRNNSKNLLYMIYYHSLELFRYQKLPHALQSFRTIVRMNSSLLPLGKIQNSYNFIDLTCSIFLLSDNLQLINLRTRKHFIVPIFNLSRTPMLMQRHDKLTKLEKNGMNGIIFCSAKLFVSSWYWKKYCKT